MPINNELRAESISISSLIGLVDYIKQTRDLKDCSYIVHVVSPVEVQLISGLDTDREREVLVKVEANVPEFRFGSYYSSEEFLINVQAKFLDQMATGDIQNDKAIILQFAGGVRAGTVAEYGDDGVGQKATIKKGVSSLKEVEIPSPCLLVPYRTFIEVEQPVSSFIFRARDNENLGVQLALFTADGGAWKIRAMENIKRFLEEQLNDVGNVMVIA